MENNLPYFTPIDRMAERYGVWVGSTPRSLPEELLGLEMTSKRICVLLTLKGTARMRYDMREIILQANDLIFLMPGHVVQFVEILEDFTYVRMYVSPAVLEEMQFHAFSRGTEKYHYQPVCQLTEKRKERIIMLGKMIDAIIEHEEDNLPLQRQILMAQLAVAYEFLNYYRQDQDRLFAEHKYSLLFNHFCDLVVAHYKESRDVKFYADLLHISTKYFSKVFHQTAGISPAEWIDRYVVIQAKRLMESSPERTIQEIAYELGFTEPTSFHHFFRRMTGMSASEWKRTPNH